jgi:DNA repair exonuclease SbcCD ATPase subunit
MIEPEKKELVTLKVRIYSNNNRCPVCGNRKLINLKKDEKIKVVIM